MLKALQLSGFKSFADRTRFEFDDGITVVVGPNGSGKSNVVDAMKWVLGEQSVKSLRGKEMADVIFNGSASRHALNMAEATLVFDNTRRFLELDEDEVRLTRRVYRSGEGEYLINDQAVRRRDIRDLVSGVASGAYCIIEQGKVDGLLQASPRDRRLIFEEAAGVSRFRIKKVETQRRLERVETNLQRLKDIVDEVGGRLKTIRNQARRARQFQEYKTRLQQLRTEVALVDWRQWTAQLEELVARAEELSAKLETASSELNEAEQGVSTGQRALATADENARAADNQAAAVREDVAREQASAASQYERLVDLAQRVKERQSALSATRSQFRDLHAAHASLFSDLQQAQLTRETHHLEFQTRDTRLREMQNRLEVLRGQNEQRREEYLGLIRELSSLQQQMTTARSALDADQQQSDKLKVRIETIERRRTELAEALRSGGEEKRAAATSAADSTAGVFRLKSELATAKQIAADLSDQRHATAARLSRLEERADVLRELEQRSEGIDAGAQFVLQRKDHPPSDAPSGGVLGLVVDLLHVNVDVAPLMETALGEDVGAVVVRSAAGFLEAFHDQIEHLPGRLRLIGLDHCRRRAGSIDLDQRPGVIGRADRFVESVEDMRPLAEDLLGDVWIVESLDCAKAIAADVAETQPPRPVRLITLDGEVLATDGRLTLGGQTRVTGPMSRRSELRAIDERIAAVQADLRQEMELEQNAQAALQDAEHRLDAAILKQRESEAHLADCSRREELLAVNAAETEDELAKAQHDQQRVLERIGRFQEQLQKDEAIADEREQRLAERERGIAAAAKEIIQLDADRKSLEQEATGAQSHLARSDERLANLQGRIKQLELDQEERGAGLASAARGLAMAQQDLAEAELTALGTESQLAMLFLRKDALLIAARESAKALAAVRVELDAQTSRAVVLREHVRKHESELHGLELAVGDLRGKRDNLAARMKDDYDIDLAAFGQDAALKLLTDEDETTTPSAEDPSVDVSHLETAEREIQELRSKLARLGNVNLEALDELDGLEARHEELSTQLGDLSQARSQLVRIIERVNGESRRLFTETLEVVREHFRGLFRKLFGGGQAEIVLEEDVDPLEAGVEIIAQPPGKELRSISLLSGGEKTLTCVALLLSLFRSRPSPFCVLDEVDAALDESNIERFTSVLREFLEITQFLVVTHSKKTMMCANTLYGVTMQESGISKRVSVRFEDVTEDGRIVKSADDQAA